MRWQDTVDAEVILDVMACVDCGVPFAFPRDLIKQRRRDGQAFYCPNGHRQGWWESDADKLRAQVRKLQLRADASAADLAAARSTLTIERRQHAATKGQLTRARKLAGAGVCPVDGCRRHFNNLARHMATKHPKQVPGG